MQNFIAGCSLMVRCKNSCASWIVYGCGKRSRTPSQIFRLFACLASDSASSSRHGRLVHFFSTSCITYLFVEFDFALLRSARGQKPCEALIMQIDELDAIAPAGSRKSQREIHLFWYLFL